MKSAVLSGAIAAACAGALIASFASAKLPAPQLTDEQKAAAAAAKAKAAHAAKLDDFRLCRSMERTAANYAKALKAQGKTLAPEPTPACADPGPFEQAAAAPAKK